MATPETKVRDWYMEAYPTDELGPELNPELTFYGLFEALDTYQDVYEAMGFGDSMVRERLFDRLAQIMGVKYGEVYDQWLMGAEVRRMNRGKAV